MKEFQALLFPRKNIFKGSDLSEIEKIHKREPSVKGAENLTNQELLAVIIAGYKKEASDAAANVLNTFDSNLIHVFCASIEQLMGIEGIIERYNA